MDAGQGTELSVLIGKVDPDNKQECPEPRRLLFTETLFNQYHNSKRCMMIRAIYISLKNYIKNNFLK